jgi:hypothetical protein
LRSPKQHACAVTCMSSDALAACRDGGNLDHTLMHGLLCCRYLS